MADWQNGKDSIVMKCHCTQVFPQKLHTVEVVPIFCLNVLFVFGYLIIFFIVLYVLYPNAHSKK